MVVQHRRLSFRDGRHMGALGPGERVEGDRPVPDEQRPGELV